jgi:hypothetical protein
MADRQTQVPFQLIACRELLDEHPSSLRIREQVDALEEAMPDRPGVVVSFCRTIIETTCKTILIDHGATLDSNWNSSKLVAESLRYLDLGYRDGAPDAKLRDGAEKLVRGLNSIIDGIIAIRNDHGSAAHGADAYAPLLDASYAEILARATDAVVGLLFRRHIGLAHRGALARFRYGAHSDFDEVIDGNYGPFEVLNVPLVASEAFYHTDFEAYRAALVQFKQEQEDQSGSVEAGAETC